MRIAFYAPMKSPNHPVPSGDRKMARLLIKALAHAGHTVEIASELRSFLPEQDARRYVALSAEALQEIDHLASAWITGARPDLWFCYHPYYKSPDLLGPSLAERFRIAYVTVEASYSARRNLGAWAEAQATVAKAIKQAAVNICLTNRDRIGLLEAVPTARIERLRPFIETAAPSRSFSRDENRLITVAMMRPGDKMDSYRMLARALEQLLDVPWRLSIVGDGPNRAEVEAVFAAIPAERIEWMGQLEPQRVAAALASASIYVWPGCGEAFGLAYLEAQAVGLPVIAQNTAGVPEVVNDGQTGILTPPGDVEAYSAAIRRLLAGEALRTKMGAAAARFVTTERSLEAAAVRLDDILRQAVQ